ncbi:MAG: hypothetical protein N4A76_09365 [Firmicutes bacterium]|jgi:hypothetical protein|nr:hypothetical protein [Bacillota bacterium]
MAKEKRRFEDIIRPYFNTTSGKKNGGKYLPIISIVLVMYALVGILSYFGIIDIALKVTN